MQSRRTVPAFVFVLCLALMPAARVHAADPAEGVKLCAKMTDRDARLACYDDLGKRLLAEESVDDMLFENVDIQAEDAEAKTAAAVPPSLPDDLGGTAFERGSDTPQNEGRVTSCKKGADNRWYFYFDNEQVWKESNTGRYRFKDCNFVATISRDGFGYKMRQEGKTRNIRVKRVR